MIERIYDIKIKKNPRSEYKITYGGCVLVRENTYVNQPFEVVSWIPFEIGKEIRETWNNYLYFLDDNGFISRQEMSFDKSKFSY